MDTKKVSPKAAQQKGGAKERPKSLTLADVAITWTEGSGTHYVTGATVARLVCTTRHRHPHTAGHAPYDDAGTLPIKLRGLSYLVFPDAGAPPEDLDKDVRFMLSELLHDAAATVETEQLTRPDLATEYRIHVGPIPEEWKK